MKFTRLNSLGQSRLKPKHVLNIGHIEIQNMPHYCAYGIKHRSLHHECLGYERQTLLFDFHHQDLPTPFQRFVTQDPLSNYLRIDEFANWAVSNLKQEIPLFKRLCLTQLYASLSSFSLRVFVNCVFLWC